MSHLDAHYIWNLRRLDPDNVSLLRSNGSCTGELVMLYQHRHFQEKFNRVGMIVGVCPSLLDTVYVLWSSPKPELNKEQST